MIAKLEKEKRYGIRELIVNKAMAVEEPYIFTMEQMEKYNFPLYMSDLTIENLMLEEDFKNKWLYYMKNIRRN